MSLRTSITALLRDPSNLSSYSSITSRAFFRGAVRQQAHSRQFSLLHATTRETANKTGARGVFPKLRLRWQRVRHEHQASKEASRPSPDPTAELGSPPQNLTLSQRLRRLSREYGWTALGVYLALSALDFPLCLLAVRMAGTERIGHLEHEVVRGFWKVVSMPFPGGEMQVRTIFRSVGDVFRDFYTTLRGGKKNDNERPNTTEKIDGAVSSEAEWNWGVDEAEQAHKKDATWATQLALAYAIHKSFIFLRVPLTAAVLPRVVKTLRGWGWEIGKRRSKAIKP